MTLASSQVIISMYRRSDEPVVALVHEIDDTGFPHTVNMAGVMMCFTMMPTTRQQSRPGCLACHLLVRRRRHQIKTWKIDVSGVDGNPEATGEQAPCKKHCFTCAVQDMVDDIPWQITHMVDVGFKRVSEEFNIGL